MRKNTNSSIRSQDLEAEIKIIQKSHMRELDKIIQKVFGCFATCMEFVMESANIYVIMFIVD